MEMISEWNLKVAVDNISKWNLKVAVDKPYKQVKAMLYLDESVHEINKTPAACRDKSMYGNMGPD